MSTPRLTNLKRDLQMRQTRRAILQNRPTVPYLPEVLLECPGMLPFNPVPRAVLRAAARPKKTLQKKNTEVAYLPTADTRLFRLLTHFLLPSLSAPPIPAPPHLVARPAPPAPSLSLAVGGMCLLAQRCCCVCVTFQQQRSAGGNTQPRQRASVELLNVYGIR
jgi:hypothetical protein